MEHFYGETELTQVLRRQLPLRIEESSRARQELKESHLPHRPCQRSNTGRAGKSLSPSLSHTPSLLVLCVPFLGHVQSFSGFEIPIGTNRALVLPKNNFRFAWLFFHPRTGLSSPPGRFGASLIPPDAGR